MQWKFVFRFPLLRLAVLGIMFNVHCIRFQSQETVSHGGASVNDDIPRIATAKLRFTERNHIRTILIESNHSYLECEPWKYFTVEYDVIKGTYFISPEFRWNKN